MKTEEMKPEVQFIYHGDKYPDDRYLIQTITKVSPDGEIFFTSSRHVCKYYSDNEYFNDCSVVEFDNIDNLTEEILELCLTSLNLDDIRKELKIKLQLLYAYGKYNMREELVHYLNYRIQS